MNRLLAILALVGLIGCGSAEEGPAVAFLWLTVHYDHRFARRAPNETEIAFVVDAGGVGAAVFGRVFAAVYRLNLKRAIPLLIRELEAP